MKSEDVVAIVRSITSNPDLNKMGAHNGSKYLGIAATTGLEVKSIYVREATTITVCTGKDATGTTYNFLTTGFNISGISLLQGDLFIVPNGFVINAITITAGSVIVYS